MGAVIFQVNILSQLFSRVLLGGFCNITGGC